ncbi:MULTISPECIES: M23 family metallopeptidase [Streptomyces]|uniref:M23 family metallopeptidase n=1 Tax=Streptomyces TaxID=1883 RepID=UPI0003C327DF|nr:MULTISPECIES: LysM peptidoglycan-binding domain-containing M23 family metallopeptidase [Streptomyces]QOZ98391.1 LysM peptidoglycan-binding domain-containing protein [Streptomyces violascens]WDV30737.1 LysM peptidoglycan-binding domain-containing M23 family metallopeptidase [Streptomyces sp. AD16]ESQ06775.1 Secreted peptidase [Streptomyces sp. PVA_94-07]MBP3076371.1 peptidase [Streptomyces sp. 604F]QHV88364.1 LysM peptidoglycan-binding domain-containing protein [Streptomyces sp. 604F]
MPAKGKHRRTRTMRIARTLAVAGSGSAALALPLMGAAHAQAAEKSAPESVAVQQAVAAAQQQAPKNAAADAETYEVVVGDYLAKIADEQHVDGGWEQLYQDNREVVGSNPNLILPGMKLSVDGTAAEAPKPAPAKPQSAPKPAAPKADSGASTAGKTETAPKPAAAAEPEAEQAEQPAATSGDWVRPVEASTSTAYRASGGSWSSGYHTGVDFSASSGTSVKAIGAGTVVSAGWSGSYGNEVVIKHADGKYSQYAHLSSLSVSSGQTVTPGQQIGLSGSTGNSTGPHLHFEVRTGPSYGSDIDPLAYLRGHGVSV